MPAIKVTHTGIKALVNKPHSKRIDYFDSAHKGLCITVGPRGGVWYYFRRIDSKLTRLRIGAWPETGIKEARTEAGRFEEDIEAGKHPKAVQARERSDKRESRRLDELRLIEKLAKEWREQHFENLAASTRRDYERLLTEFVEAFRGRDAAKIKRGEIIRHLDTIKARSASQANRAAVVIRQLYNHALDRYDLPANPASGLKNPAKPTRRKRTLDRQEIRVLWRACELAGYPYGHALRLALCTGQRIGEIGFMRWQDIEGDWWRNTENKTGQRIDIFLARQAAAILKHCPRLGDYVFTHGKTGIRSDTWGGGTSGAIARHIAPMIDPAAVELRVKKPDDDKPAIREHFTAHDLRRTVRTGLTGWAGVLPDTAERVLNHSISGLRAHYDFADYRPHVTEALKAWSAELGRILAGKKATVTPIKAATA